MGMASTRLDLDGNIVMWRTRSHRGGGAQPLLSHRAPISEGTLSHTQHADLRKEGPMVPWQMEWAGRSSTFPGAFPWILQGSSNDIETRRSTATAPLHMQGCVLESRNAISGARYPDAVLIMIFHGQSWLLIMFLPGGRAKSFPKPTSGLEEPSRFREPLHNKIQLARTKR